MASRVIGVVGAFQFMFTVLVALLLGQQQKINSVCLGSGLSMINFILLVYLWKVIFHSPKKSVALPLFLIVIKYAILIWVFMQIPREKSLDAFEFAVGVLLNPAAVISAGFCNKFFRKQSFENKK